MPSHSRLSRREYTGNLSLKTTDHCKKASFLAKFSPRTPQAISETKNYVNGQLLLELDNVLSSRECTEVIKNAEKYIFENMNDKYRFGKQRKSSRLLALDRSLAENLWDSLKAVLSETMEELGISKCPHGFDVTRGEWELHGINEAMRINKYSGMKKEYFGPHKDAQFCPNGDERSIFTLLVYLNEEFRGGQTCFYFFKDPNENAKGVTIKEEIESQGGLCKGYDCVKIVPKLGHAIISSQDILHESLPVVKGTKYVLKTDVVVKRYSKQFGFAVEESEKNDYVTCLNFFREAQQQELQGNFNVASDLYEKALSIRYCYPQCPEECEEQTTPEKVENTPFSIFPWDIWYQIFKHLPGYDAQQLVYAYPELNYVKAMWEQRQRNAASNLSNEKYLPKLRYQKGVITSFEFSDAEFFLENMTGCCRVAAMYSFFLLSHRPQDTVYTVRYNPDTQDVCVVALETLLADVFYSRRCYGSFYNIRQQDPETRDPKRDFEASVDRNYMLLQHGVEFTGVELPDSFYVKSVVYPSSVCDSYPESDEEETSENESGYDSGQMSEYSDDDRATNMDSDRTDENDLGGNGKQKDIFDNDVEDKCGRRNNSETKDVSYGASKGEEEVNCGPEVKYQEREETESSTQNILPNEEMKTIKKGDPTEVKAKTTKEICNGVVGYVGEFEEKCYVSSLLRYLLLAEDSSRADLPVHDDEYELMQRLVGEDPESEVETYFDNCTGETRVSTARVSKLKHTLRLDKVCICHFGPDEDVMEYVEDACSTEFFNHLVFDFQTQKLSVKYLELAEEKASMLDESYVGALNAEMALLECTGESVRCEINIETLLSSDTSFNHASCQCCHPNFDVHEYYNLKDYPQIDHVFVTAKEKSEKMIVWTVYGGIVAL